MATRMLLAAALSIVSLCTLSLPVRAEEPIKVFLSMSFVGNQWQEEAANTIRAMAASKKYKEKVTFEVQVAGPNAQKQIQQINAMVQAGAKAIIVYPISPTALNQAVKAACDKGVTVVAYDGEITEPCAYNVHIDQAEDGRVGAQWLADYLKGKGNIVMITGVAGTSVDSDRVAASKKVFANYPEIKIVAEANGMWGQQGARTALSKIVAAHPWETIDGILMQVGCYTAASMQDEAGIPDDKKIPCAGEQSQGHRIQMLPSGTKVEGTSGTYRPMGYPSISYSVPASQGAIAFKVAMDVIDGKNPPKTTIVPIKPVKMGEVRICETGSWKEMDEGCNVFKPTVVTDPGFMSGIYTSLTPEIGLAAALHGSPEE
ncbi:substrate-binding domain-containing protein [Mesorhizobium sp. CU2]|nr:substrate-binding domain-containing protein [Mesorhizobium sp. CU3]TPO09830.1 substrate-binding domain-containing protein [Mesorhizobium sp. CU2]